MLLRDHVESVARATLDHTPPNLLSVGIEKVRDCTVADMIRPATVVIEYVGIDIVALCVLLFMTTPDPTEMLVLGVVKLAVTTLPLTTRPVLMFRDGSVAVTETTLAGTLILPPASIR
jgi:hypothetical protein